MLHFNFKFKTKTQNPSPEKPVRENKDDAVIIQNSVVEFKKEFRMRVIVFIGILILAVPGFMMSQKKINAFVHDLKVLRGDNVWHNKNFEALAVLTGGRERAAFLANEMQAALPVAETLRTTFPLRVAAYANTYRVVASTTFGTPLVSEETNPGVMPFTLHGEGEFNAVREFLSVIEQNVVIITFKKIVVHQKSEKVFEYIVDGVIATRPASLATFALSQFPARISEEMPQSTSSVSVISTTSSMIQNATSSSFSSQITKIRVTETPTGFLNVRATPSSQGVLITKILPNEVYTTNIYENGWYHIFLPENRKGWVSEKYVVRE